MARLGTLLSLALALCAFASGFVVPSRRATGAWALRAKAAGGSSNSNNIRVRFLADVKGQGKKGEIGFVSAALYQNVLAAQRLAERVSDEQFAKETAESAAKDEATRLHQTELKAKIDALTNVQIKKKIGENGKIFGAVTRKALLEHLRTLFPKEVEWSSKLTVLEILTESTGERSTKEGDDLRVAGKYTAKINLGHPKVEPALLKLEIVSQ